MYKVFSSELWIILYDFISLNDFLNSRIYFSLKIKEKLLNVPSPMYTAVYTGADMWARGTQLTSQTLTSQQGVGPTCHRLYLNNSIKLT